MKFLNENDTKKNVLQLRLTQQSNNQFCKTVSISTFIEGVNQ